MTVKDIQDRGSFLFVTLSIAAMRCWCNYFEVDVRSEQAQDTWRYGIIWHIITM